MRLIRLANRTPKILVLAMLCMPLCAVACSCISTAFEDGMKSAQIVLVGKVEGINWTHHGEATSVLIEHPDRVVIEIRVVLKGQISNRHVEVQNPARNTNCAHASFPSLSVGNDVVLSINRAAQQVVKSESQVGQYSRPVGGQLFLAHWCGGSVKVIQNSMEFEDWIARKR